MHTRTWIVASALALLAPSVSRADTIDVDSTTMLNMAKQTRGGQVGQPFDLANTATAFEILTISARDIRNGFADDLSLVVGTWAAYDIQDRRWDSGIPSAFTADLSSAYAQARFIGRRLTLRLGRTEVAAGTARMMQIDGGEAVAFLPAGFRISGYAGSPVSQRFTTRSGVLTWNAIGGTLAYGGRLGWSLVLPGGAGRGLDVGTSVNWVEDKGNPVKQEVGADARLKLVDPLVITGSGAYSVYDKRVAEAIARLGWTVNPKVLLEADYQYLAPDLFLARNSILSVFSAEERQIFGGGATWFAGRGIKVAGFYHLQLEPGATEGAAKYVGQQANARVEWQRGPTLAGIEGFYLTAFENGYVGGRLYGRRDFGRAFAAVDVLAYFFREDVNGHSSDFTGALTLGYDLLSGLSAVISGQGGVTPFMEQTFSFMAKLVYGQTYRKTEVR
jgi:hypothetical protein